jgi:aspartyl-tRNA(Asn)/glutamyl-tRNA(Gln) amidotransferase subunit B
LPSDRRARLAEAAGVEPTSGGVAVAVSRGLDDLARAAIEAKGDPARVLTHVEHNLAVEGAAAVEPAALARLTRMEVDGALTATQAKTVLAELVEQGGDPEAIAKAKGFEAMDTSALDGVIDDVIASNADVWTKYVSGDDKAVAFLTGQVMKATQGKADGKAVNAGFRERREAAGE